MDEYGGKNSQVPVPPTIAIKASSDKVYDPNRYTLSGTINSHQPLKFLAGTIPVPICNIPIITMHILNSNNTQHTPQFKGVDLILVIWKKQILLLYKLGVCPRITSWDLTINTSPPLMDRTIPGPPGHKIPASSRIYIPPPEVLFILDIIAKTCYQN